MKKSGIRPRASARIARPSAPLVQSLAAASVVVESPSRGSTCVISRSLTRPDQGAWGRIAAMQIAESSALVVGGASGLGEATARALHERGALVTIADVNAEKGQALSEELGAQFVPCDVREESQVEAAVAQAAAGVSVLRL